MKLNPRVDAELFKWQAVEMLQEAGVRIRLHTWACAPIMVDGGDADARVGGVYAESKSGREAFRAQVTIDVTADADRGGIVIRDGVIVVPQDIAVDVARYAKRELDKDKMARKAMYEDLGMELDDTVT